MMTNSDVVKRSDKLDVRLEEQSNLNQSVADLITYGKRNRRLIRWVIGFVIVEIFLVAILAFVFARQQQGLNQVVKNHESLIAACNSGNEFRKDNLKLWDYILAFPSPQPQTAEQQKMITDFKAFVNQTFTLRDCNAIK